MKKIIIIVAAIIMAACSSDPIKEKLSQSIDDPGYRLEWYFIEDTMTYKQMVDFIMIDYFLEDFIKVEDFMKLRDNLSALIDRHVKEFNSYGIEPFESSIIDPREALSLMDSVINIYDDLGYYSLTYQYAMKKYTNATNYIMGYTSDSDLHAQFNMENDFGVEDFETANRMMKEKDKKCIVVDHYYSSKGLSFKIPGEMVRRSHEDLVVFDTDLNVIYQRRQK